VVLLLTRSKAYQHELSGWFISPGCNGGTPFYLNRQERVNIISTFLSRLPTTQDMIFVKRPRSARRPRARSLVRSRLGPITHPPVADRENVALAKTPTAEAAVWGEAERTGELLE